MHIRHTVSLAVLLGSMTLTGLAHAAGMKTYTNSAHGYSMSYPAAWGVYPHAHGTDIEFRAPDTNALVNATATKVPATPAQIKALLASAIKKMGKPQGPLSNKVVTINSVSYEISALVTKAPDGSVLDAAFLGTEHGGYLYTFAALLLYTGPTYKAETKTVQQILNSIVLTK